jgi:hypothetical protein
VIAWLKGASAAGNELLDLLNLAGFEFWIKLASGYLGGGSFSGCRLRCRSRSFPATPVSPTAAAAVAVTTFSASATFAASLELLIDVADFEFWIKPASGYLSGRSFSGCSLRCRSATFPATPVSPTAAVAVTTFSAFSASASATPAASLELLIDITLFNRPIELTGGEIALDVAGFQVKIEVPSVEIKIEFSNLQISIEVASFNGGDIVFLGENAATSVDDGSDQSNAS